MSTLILLLVLGQPVPPVNPASKIFECTLPYLNGGGIVTLVNASDEDQIVEITANNAYWYNIVVSKNSIFSFPSPAFEYFFSPIIHGGPMSFRSEKTIVAYSILNEDAITVQCSDPTRPTKIFVGSAKTGIGLVNIGNIPIAVRIFQDEDQTPLLSLTIPAKGRLLEFLGNKVSITGKHTYRMVADGYGFGLLAVSYDSGVASSIPIGEYASPETSSATPLAPPSPLSNVERH